MTTFFLESLYNIQVIYMTVNVIQWHSLTNKGWKFNWKRAVWGQFTRAQMWISTVYHARKIIWNDCQDVWPRKKIFCLFIQSHPFIINHPVCIICLQSNENVSNPEATWCNWGLILSGVYNNSWPTYFKWCNRACDSLICTNKMSQ